MLYIGFLLVLQKKTSPSGDTLIPNPAAKTQNPPVILMFPE